MLMLLKQSRSVVSKSMVSQGKSTVFLSESIVQHCKLTGGRVMINRCKSGVLLGKSADLLGKAMLLLGKSSFNKSTAQRVIF